MSDGAGTLVTVVSEGKARLISHQEIEAYIDFSNGSLIPQILMTEAELYGLPEPQEGVLYIVSGIVASTAARKDVVSPGRSQREANGSVIAARGLIRSYRNSKLLK